MAEYFLNADTGDNSTGDGSSGSPWETLAYAFDQSSAGDTIICQDSTATYSFVDDTFDHNITIQGEQDDASGAVFDGAGGQNIRWFVSAGVTLNITKITFTNVNDTTEIPSEISAHGDNATITATSCVFHDWVGYGSPGSQGAILCAGDTGHLTGVTITAISCLFYDIHNVANTYGILNTRTSINATLNMTSCTVYSNTETPVSGVVVAFSLEAGNVINLKNNIYVDGQSASLKIISTGGGGIAVSKNVSYNDYYGTVDEGGTGSITSDPLFVDVDNNNFNLRPSSPCIDSASLT